MTDAFVCEFDISLEEYKFWAKHPLGATAVKNRKRSLTLRWVGFALSILVVIIGAVLKSFPYIAVGAAFLTIFVARLFFTDDVILKKQYEIVRKALNGGEWRRAYRFSGSVRAEDGRSVSVYEYKEFKNATEDGGYFYLWLSDDFVMRLPKIFFTEGSPDGFLPFIEEKLAGAKAEESAPSAEK